MIVLGRRPFRVFRFVLAISVKGCENSCRSVSLSRFPWTHRQREFTTEANNSSLLTFSMDENVSSMIPIDQLVLSLAKWRLASDYRRSIILMSLADYLEGGTSEIIENSISSKQLSDTDTILVIKHIGLHIPMNWLELESKFGQSLCKRLANGILDRILIVLANNAAIENIVGEVSAIYAGLGIPNHYFSNVDLTQLSSAFKKVSSFSHCHHMLFLVLDCINSQVTYTGLCDELCQHLNSTVLSQSHLSNILKVIESVNSTLNPSVVAASHNLSFGLSIIDVISRKFSSKSEAEALPSSFIANIFRLLRICNCTWEVMSANQKLLLLDITSVALDKLHKSLSGAVQHESLPTKFNLNAIFDDMAIVGPVLSYESVAKLIETAHSALLANGEDGRLSFNLRGMSSLASLARKSIQLGQTASISYPNLSEFMYLLGSNIEASVPLDCLDYSEASQIIEVACTFGLELEAFPRLQSALDSALIVQFYSETDPVKIEKLLSDGILFKQIVGDKCISQDLRNVLLTSSSKDEHNPKASDEIVTPLDALSDLIIKGEHINSILRNIQRWDELSQPVKRDILKPILSYLDTYGMQGRIDQHYLEAYLIVFDLLRQIASLRIDFHSEMILDDQSIGSKIIECLSNLVNLQLPIESGINDTTYEGSIAFRILHYLERCSCSWIKLSTNSREHLMSIINFGLDESLSNSGSLMDTSISRLCFALANMHVELSPELMVKLMDCCNSYMSNCIATSSEQWMSGNILFIRAISSVTLISFEAHRDPNQNDISRVIRRWELSEALHNYLGSIHPNATEFHDILTFYVLNSLTYDYNPQIANVMRCMYTLGLPLTKDSLLLNKLDRILQDFFAMESDMRNKELAMNIMCRYLGSREGSLSVIQKSALLSTGLKNAVQQSMSIVVPRVALDDYFLDTVNLLKSQLLNGATWAEKSGKKGSRILEPFRVSLEEFLHKVEKKGIPNDIIQSSTNNLIRILAVMGNNRCNYHSNLNIPIEFGNNDKTMGLVMIELIRRGLYANIDKVDEANARHLSAKFVTVVNELKKCGFKWGLTTNDEKYALSDLIQCGLTCMKRTLGSDETFDTSIRFDRVLLAVAYMGVTLPLTHYLLLLDCVVLYLQRLLNASDSCKHFDELRFERSEGRRLYWALTVVSFNAFHGSDRQQRSIREYLKHHFCDVDVLYNLLGLYLEKLVWWTLYPIATAVGPYYPKLASAWKLLEQSLA